MSNDLRWDQCVYIGDDVNDVGPGKRVGLLATPADAQPVLSELSGLRLGKNGGAGAVREFADLVLATRGIDPKDLPPA